MDLKIFIPTHKRYNRQTTWNNLPLELLHRTNLVVAHGETPNYSKVYTTLETPKDVVGIGATRQWILEYSQENNIDKIVMLDDDLTFAIRRTDDQSKFGEPKPSELLRLFSSMDMHLDHYAHCTILAREGGNRILKSLDEVGRAMRVLAFRTDILRKESVSFDRRLVQDDFDITLALLALGYPNLRICWAVHNQAGSGAAGGASAYRSIETHNASVALLKEKWQDFVAVVNKQTKVAWGGRARLDVVIQWKKAYESAKVKHFDLLGEGTK